MPITLDWIKVQYFMEQRGIEDANELAVLAETHRSSMHRVSTGQSLPNMQTLARMCFYLGCQPGDLLNYEHSELDLSKPHFLFGLFPINQKVWTKFRKLDKGWRKNIGRWELNSGVDLVDFQSKGTYGVDWKEGAFEEVMDEDGNLEPIEWIDTLRARLMGHGSQSELKDSFDAADRFANFDIVDAIGESYFKYAFKVHWNNRTELAGSLPDDDFDTLEKLEAVYEKDAGVLSARNAYTAYYSNRVIEISSLERLTQARLGCEIERDYHMLKHYASANDTDDLIDYAEHSAIPIHNMDKEIKQFDRWINDHTRKIKADETLARTIAQGMGDKED